MAKARLKPKHQNYEETYWDSSGIVHENSSLYTILENIAAVYKHGSLPKHITLAELDQTRFGIYTILNDPDGPYNNGDNSWYTIVNIPANQGTNYSIQLAFSYWELAAGSFGAYIRHGRGDTWRQINLSPTQTPQLQGIFPILSAPYSSSTVGTYQIGSCYNFKEQLLGMFPKKVGWKRSYKVVIAGTCSTNGVDIILGGYTIGNMCVWGHNGNQYIRPIYSDITSIVEAIADGHCAISIKNTDNGAGTWYYINQIYLLVYDTYAG